jgi:hypothetical protein
METECQATLPAAAIDAKYFRSLSAPGILCSSSNQRDLCTCCTPSSVITMKTPSVLEQGTGRRGREKLAVVQDN